MKILALHGLGSSSAMLKEQFACVIRDLGPSYSFTFLDGAISCNRGPGVPPWASGPFYSHSASFTPGGMRDALDNLDVFTNKHGPFDGVFGFSMGASIAIAYMLDHQSRYPEQRPPFGFAVLFSPIFVVSPDKACCEQVVQRLFNSENGAFRSAFPHANCTALLVDDLAGQTFAEYLQLVFSMQTLDTELTLPNNEPQFFLAGRADLVPRLLHPSLFHGRVHVPTVFVAGKMTGTMRVGMKHLLHEAPVDKSDVAAIVSSINEAAKEGQLLNDLYEL
ncbi:hypothetical protein VE02_08557 [Pseudogymnoascus sp. 03VT05]|nr:hypothetical protein VE02_08557 [Pseudogymnoascus sp. 03VT05]